MSIMNINENANPDPVFVGGRGLGVGKSLGSSENVIYTPTPPPFSLPTKSINTNVTPLVYTSNFSNIKRRFSDFFIPKTLLYRIFLIFSWQIKSFIDYLNFIKYGFGLYEKPYINKNLRNFVDLNINYIDEQSIQDVQTNLGLSENTLTLARLEWESKFIPKTTEAGLKEYFKLYVRENLLEKGIDDNTITDILNSAYLNVYNWFDSSISSISDDVYFYEENNNLTVYIEITLPKKYMSYFGVFSEYAKNIKVKLEKRLAPTIKIGYLEMIWS